ncbi:MAG TPA: hypothetical protein VN065_06590 [Bradyrhizobium sp.]|nr:hypothetical protein [Bradyrhizobium sp.]
MSAKFSKKDNEAEACAHRADCNECRLPAPIRESGSLGDRHIDNQRIIRQRMHRFDPGDPGGILLGTKNATAFGQ